MIRNWVLLVIGFLSFNMQMHSQELDAYFYYAPFYAPGSGTYVETYLAFAGNSLYYIMDEDSLLQASLEVTMLFKNADEIKEFRKFNVVSPPLPDTATIFPSFIDLQRIAIPEGVYNFDLIIKDNHAPDSLENFNLTTLLTVNIPENEMAFSGIEFIERYEKAIKSSIFVKSGYECIPYVSDFFPENIDYLRFYTELYNAAKDLGPLEDFLISFHIENYNTSKPLRDFGSFQKQQAHNVNVIFKEINISQLPSGNYYLVIEIRNRENELLLSQKKFFQRLKEGIKEKEVKIAEVEIQNTFASLITGKDTLVTYLKSLKPICDKSEIRFIENQVEAMDEKLMQQFFYNFWEKRNAANPEYAWSDYKNKLINVQEKFGSRLVQGFETDRGRVYLQYGPPSSIISETTETSAYPYEIWHYYHIADQTNKKFIFYDRNLSGNDYELLHSNMIGEINNPEWEQALYSRMEGANNQTYGRTKARQHFEEN